MSNDNDNDIDIEPRIRNKTRQNIENNITNIPKTKEEIKIENEQWFIESKLWIVIICITLLIITMIVIYFIWKYNNKKKKKKIFPDIRSIPPKLYKRNIKKEEKYVPSESLKNKIRQKINNKNSRMDNDNIQISDFENKLEVISEESEEEKSEDESYSDNESDISEQSSTMQSNTQPNNMQQTPWKDKKKTHNIRHTPQKEEHSSHELEEKKDDDNQSSHITQNNILPSHNNIQDTETTQYVVKAPHTQHVDSVKDENNDSIKEKIYIK